MNLALYRTAWTLLLVAGLVLFSRDALAQYGRVPVNTIDPAMIAIDEEAFLGARLDMATRLVGADGQEFALGSRMGKPIILLLSYFRCDGVCPTVTRDLLAALNEADGDGGIGGFKRGEDYSVLTLSFDSLDGVDNLRSFKREVGIDDPAWQIALFKDPEAIRPFTRSIDFKFFWSERDRTFIHPNVLIFVSPEGRVTRYLYGAAMNGGNIRAALAEAGFGREGRSARREITDIFLMACYSYNYKEGRYTMNYPLFIASGSLALGVSFTVFGLVYFKRRKARRR